MEVKCLAQVQGKKRTVVRYFSDFFQAPNR
jgi:hypothetical protein